MVGPVHLRADVVARYRDVVQVVGPVPRAEVAGWLNRFDMLLFPTTCEGSAGSLMEAMAGGLPVVTSPNSGTVARDGVEELGDDGRVEIPRALLDHPQAEVNVAEQPAFLGLTEARPTPELAHATDVVEKCRRQQEVGAQARMELRGLAAQRRHPDRVLEQPSRVAVVPVGSRSRQRTEGGADL